MEKPTPNCVIPGCLENDDLENDYLENDNLENGDLENDKDGVAWRITGLEGYRRREIRGR